MKICLQYLKPRELEAKNGGEWNVFKESKNNQLTITEDGDLKVSYGCGSGAPHLKIPGGFTMYAAPKGAFPTEEAMLKFDVYFDPKFQWVKGGKLGFGFFMGEVGASGGKHDDDAGSFRVMWRKEGAAEAYVYVPTNVEQLPDYDRLPGLVRNKDYGDSVFRGFASFETGKWMTVCLRAKLNTPGKADGLLSISLDGKSETYKKMNWRKDSSIQISGIVGASFFGGSGKDWCTPIATYVLHRNIVLQTFV